MQHLPCWDKASKLIFVSFENVAKLLEKKLHLIKNIYNHTAYILYIFTAVKTCVFDGLSTKSNVAVFAYTQHVNEYCFLLVIQKTWAIKKHFVKLIHFFVAECGTVNFRIKNRFSLVIHLLISFVLSNKKDKTTNVLAIGKYMVINKKHSYTRYKHYRKQ